MSYIPLPDAGAYGSYPATLPLPQTSYAPVQSISPTTLPVTSSYAPVATYGAPAMTSYVPEATYATPLAYSGAVAPVAAPAYYGTAPVYSHGGNPNYAVPTYSHGQPGAYAMPPQTYGHPTIHPGAYAHFPPNYAHGHKSSYGARPTGQMVHHKKKKRY
eukprot:NODE_2875_length_630_cov_165.507745_g2393_i0.p1 GENE.NODE_2875_length_630_cov_165.507745_g2393_i0~~NODE_2875_length_630_cov_165.507745_g2393_i0.p1  ORF type:complete len:176 (+),score=37.57 NODE_2875_length_630_cov_165.507745_g2393_i0:52-528(+)